MNPVQYIRLLRRRWRLPVALCVIGLAVGWVSTPAKAGPAPPPATYFRATHTLIVGGPGSGSVNLAQYAFLTKTGEIPELVAAKIGGEPQTLSAQVSTTANPELGTLRITAAQSDGQRAKLLADTFAETLVEYYTDKAASRQAQVRDVTIERLDRLRAEIAELDRQVAAGAGDVVEAQRDSLVNQYRLTYEQFQQLSYEGVPGAGVVTLEEAEPVQITGRDFLEVLKQAAGIAPANTSRNRNRDPEPVDEEALRLLTRRAQADIVAKELRPPAPPSDPNPTMRAGLGGILGLLLGVGAILVLDRFDLRIKSKEDAEGSFALPVIAEIPFLSKRQRRRVGIESLMRPGSAVAESYRLLRTALVFFGTVPGERAAGPDVLANGQANGNGNGNGHVKGHGTETHSRSGGQTILVTSPGPSEGKTTTSANLAAVFAESGKKVLVVNCDFRRPRVHELLRTPDSPALSELLDEGGFMLDDATVDRFVLSTSVPNVWLVNTIAEAGGLITPAQALALQRRLVEKTRDRFDVILLDTAPVLTANDAIDLLPVADAVVFVGRVGKTSREAADRAAEQFERLRAPVVGVVLIGAHTPPAGQRYYYTMVNRGGAEVPPPVPAGVASGSHHQAGSGDASGGERGSPPS